MMQFRPPKGDWVEARGLLASSLPLNIDCLAQIFRQSAEKSLHEALWLFKLSLQLVRDLHKFSLALMQIRQTNLPVSLHNQNQNYSINLTYISWWLGSEICISLFFLIFNSWSKSHYIFGFKPLHLLFQLYIFHWVRNSCIGRSLLTSKCSWWKKIATMWIFATPPQECLHFFLTCLPT